MKKKLSTAMKPRNPLVAAARFRRAGPHGSRGASRQAGQIRLRNELKALKQSP